MNALRCTRSRPSLGARIFPALILGCLLGAAIDAAASDDWVVMPSGTTATLRRVFGFSGQDVFAVGYLPGDGVVLHFDGTQWRRMADPGGYVFYDVWGSAHDDVWVVGGPGVISHYNGLGWSQLPLPVSSNFVGIYGLARDDVMAVASDGTIIHYDGTEWQEMESPASWPQMHEVWGSAPDDWWSVGQWYVINHYDGVSWTNAIYQGDQWIWGIWGASATDVWAGGIYGAIYHYDGGGWTEQVPPVAAGHIYDIWGTAATDVYAVGIEGLIYHYDGQDWTSTVPPVTVPLHGIWGPSAGEAFVVGENGTILHRDRLTGVGQPPAASLALSAWPNPLNPRVTIRYRLPAPAAVDLRVYDVSGGLVRVLLTGEAHGVGDHETFWDGRDGRGRQVPSGAYLVRLNAAGARAAIKLLLSR